MTNRLPWVFLLLTVAAISGAFGWMHLGAINPTQGIRLETAESVVGYEFSHESLSEFALGMLLTTNYVNGVFRREGESPVTVFAADWESDGSGLTVVQHTPDICWVQGGWTYGESGLPSSVEMEVSFGTRSNSVSIPFECRLFVSPDRVRKELTLWTTILGGVPVAESPSIAADNDLPSFFQHGKIRGPITRTKMAARRFTDAVARKAFATGDKQFVRFSITASHDQNHDLDQLRNFASRWLSLINRAQSDSTRK